MNWKLHAIKILKPSTRQDTSSLLITVFFLNVPTDVLMSSLILYLVTSREWIYIYVHVCVRKCSTWQGMGVPAFIVRDSSQEFAARTIDYFLRCLVNIGFDKQHLKDGFMIADAFNSVSFQQEFKEWSAVFLLPTVPLFKDLNTV